MDQLDGIGLILDSIFYRVSTLQILQGVYLKVYPGTVCGLFGRNGCGKSTLLKVAAGELTPDGGHTIIDGERLDRKVRKRRFKKIAYLPQEPMLPLDMAVDRLIESFPAATRRISCDPLIKSLLGKRVAELSVGMRRYLEVVLLMSLGRSYVLLDEPFTGIEPFLIEQVAKRIAEAAEQGSGILLTDHHRQYAMPIITNAYIMINKQCKPVQPGADPWAQLQRYDHVGGLQT